MKMKNIFKQIFLTTLVMLSLWGCESYLDVPPDANISQEDIFSNYNSYQGFVDQLYESMVDYNNHAICVSANLGGETMGSKGWNSGYHGSYGKYWDLVNNGSRSIFVGYGSSTNGVQERGLWDFAWVGARIANISLQNLHLLTNAN